MALYVVDVESNGPIPGKYSMLDFGAVRVDQNEGVDQTLLSFYSGKLLLTGTTYDLGAIQSLGYQTAEQLYSVHDKAKDPRVAMEEFEEWVKASNRSGYPQFISDNNGFDWQWINYYFHSYLGRNLFGYSSRRIGDLYAGSQFNLKAQSSWKHLRRTPHTHHPVDDAKGNAQALLQILSTWEGKSS